jgi:hypothetical protein
MMKEFTSNGVNWLIVQVPQEAIRISVKDYKDLDDVLEYELPNDSKLRHIPIPFGNYHVYCIAEEIDDEQAKGFGFVALTKDGNIYKWGIPDKDGWPGGYAKGTGWEWSEFVESATKAVDKLMRMMFSKTKGYKHVILKKL